MFFRCSKDLYSNFRFLGEYRNEFGSDRISERGKFINDNFDDNEYCEFPRNLKLIKQR